MVILHVIEETAAHSGHLEIARELLDGKTDSACGSRGAARAGVNAARNTLRAGLSLKEAQAQPEQSLLLRATESPIMNW